MTRLAPKLPPDAAQAPSVVNVKPARQRLDSIDLLRGLVMVVMALDHVKSFLPGTPIDATDLTKTTAPYFLTRWISHFCAPTFVFLAGTGAFLYGARGKSKGQLAWFLLSRGLWLILLELTVIRFSWVLNLNDNVSVGQVIWATGCSMIVLAGLVFLPTSFVSVFGVSMILFHNLFDPVKAADWGEFHWFWRILHTGETLHLFAGRDFAPAYPLVPWIGVLAAGYGFGALMLLEPHRRRKEVLGLGLALILVFIALRYSNLYGDRIAQQPGQPGPWAKQKDWLMTIFSFVNCQKYPPSLCYLLMTLGPAITAVALFDRPSGPLGRFLVTFGRVPLFFYILHFYLIKGVGILLAYMQFGRADWLYGTPVPDQPRPADFGHSLWVVYLIWIGVIAILYPLCYWFAGVKQRSRAAWLSYL